MTIPNIIVNDSRIFTHPISNISIYRLPQPLIFNVHPPVTLQLGFPIVELPGCVTFHPDDQNKVTKLPFDDKQTEQFLLDVSIFRITDIKIS